MDTGIHHLGCDRDRAIGTMEAAGLESLEAVTEVDRYITDPGQALAYATGMREILALCRKAEARADFDLPRFHDAVLGSGSPPLGVLRDEFDHLYEANNPASGGRQPS